MPPKNNIVVHLFLENSVFTKVAFDNIKQVNNNKKIYLYPVSRWKHSVH